MNLEMRIEQIGEEHIEPYCRLSRSEYGELAAVSQSSHLRWKFLHNPQGPSIGINLYSGSEIVGRLVAMPRKIVCRGIVYTAAFMVDLLIERAYRGMHPMLQLVEGLGRLTGFDLILLTPNPLATAVWEKLFEMSSEFDFGVAAASFRPARMAQLSGRVKLGRMAALVDVPWRTMIGGLSWFSSVFAMGKIESKWPSESELESLFSAGLNHPRATGLRTVDFLEWRFRLSPVFHYDIDFLRQGGELVGYLVTRRSQYAGYDCRFIVDAFANPNQRHVSWRAMRLKLLSAGVAEGTEMALAIGNTKSGPLADFSKLPFIDVPQRILPRRMKLFGRWNSAPGFRLRPEDLDLTLADCDMV
jgi:hypothetical protein